MILQNIFLLSYRQIKLAHIYLLVDEVIEALRSAGFKLTPSDRCIDTMAFDISWKNISKE